MQRLYQNLKIKGKLHHQTFLINCILADQIAKMKDIISNFSKKDENQEPIIQLKTVYVEKEESKEELIQDDQQQIDLTHDSEELFENNKYITKLEIEISDLKEKLIQSDKSLKFEKASNKYSKMLYEKEKKTFTNVGTQTSSDSIEMLLFNDLLEQLCGGFKLRMSHKRELLFDMMKFKNEMKLKIDRFKSKQETAQTINKTIEAYAENKKINKEKVSQGNQDYKDFSHNTVSTNSKIPNTLNLRNKPALSTIQSQSVESDKNKYELKVTSPTKQISSENASRYYDSQNRTDSSKNSLNYQPTNRSISLDKRSQTREMRRPKRNDRKVAKLCASITPSKSKAFCYW